MTQPPLPDRQRDRAQELFSILCRQPSVSAQGHGMDEMAGLTERLLREAGFAVQLLSIPNAPPIVYGQQTGRSSFTVLLYNHYDVQPVEPLALWDSPPFEPTERDGKLFARGASDNKGQIAARLTAIEALRDEDGELPVTVRWILEGEEEIGSRHFGEIVEPYADLLRADGCLWEGDGFDQSGRPQATLGAKGMLYVELSVACMTQDAHSGNAPILPSAAWRLVQALACVRAPDGTVMLDGFYDAVRPPSDQQREVMLDLPDEEDALKALYGIDAFLDNVTGYELNERHSFAPTANIAGITSGYAGEGLKTVLPARARAKMDFRLVPDQHPDEVVASLRRHLDRHGYGDVAIEVLGTAEPVVTPMNEPFVRRVLEVAQRFAGARPAVTPISGGSLPLLYDLQRVAGVPGLSAPDNVSYLASGAHAPNEHIQIADLHRGVAFSMNLFRELAR